MLREEKNAQLKPQRTEKEKERENNLKLDSNTEGLRKEFSKTEEEEK